MSEYLIMRDDSEPLTHYGVRGMKWKKRKKSQIGSSKNKEWSERRMYDAGAESKGLPSPADKLNRIRPFHDDGESPDGKGYKARNYNPSLKGTIENRKSLWKKGYYTRKEGTLSSKTNYKKIVKNKAKKVLKTSRKAINKGKTKFRKIWN